MNHQQKKQGLANMYISDGQKLALKQLDEICAISLGRIEFEITHYPQCEAKNLELRLSMKTDHFKKMEEGFSFGIREAFEIAVGPDFPLQIPSANFVHKRFAGKPHVLWGKWICLYLSPNTEWNPRNGMYGFIDRLNEWLAAAARDELDPENAPLHPPVTYSKSTSTVVIRANTPKFETNIYPWVGYAKLTKRSNFCYDLVAWSEDIDSNEESFQFTPAILFGTPLPMEFPEHFYDLIFTIMDNGVPPVKLFQLLIMLVLDNKRKFQHMIVGTPTKSVESGDFIKHHIAVWEVDDKIIQSILDAINKSVNIAQNENLILNFFKSLSNVNIKWCAIQENRSETTIRRDEGTAANCLLRKKILLLGCGAIGSHIAEHITKAGPELITLVDNKAVTEGSLVRQSFRGLDVGINKSYALCNSLKSLSLVNTINYDVSDIITNANSILNAEHYNLIIDATASRMVTYALERELQQIAYSPVFISVSVSAKAEFGSLLVRMPNHTDGVYSLTRRSKIKAFWNPNFEKCAHSFWPPKGSTTIFQPEPGCSEPTFIASNIDVAWYASSFLNSSLRLQSQHPDDNAVSMFFDKSGNQFTPISLSKSKIYNDCKSNFKIHLYPDAENVIDASIETNRRLGIEEEETGGYLFGEIDETLNSVWLDFACGPSPDSIMSKEFYESGIEGVKKLTDFYSSKTGDTTEFTGFWHSHPVSPPIPSCKDMKTINRIFKEKITTRKRIVLLIVGMSATKPESKFYVFHRDEFLNGELP